MKILLNAHQPIYYIQAINGVNMYKMHELQNPNF